MSQASFTNDSKIKYHLYPVLIICAIIVGWLTVQIGVGMPAALIGLISVFLYFIAVFKEPKIAILTCILYSFIFVFFIREVAPLPFMYAIEILLVMSWIAAVMHNSKQYNWTLMKNDLVTWGLVWVFYNFAELANPQAGSIMGWLVDVRYPIWWLLIIPLCMVVFNTERDLNKFINLIIFVSLLAAFFGMRQLSGNYLPGEKAFLAGPDGATHLLFGKLRVFSFMSDAGEFGASQAQMATVAFIMALAPIKPWKRIMFFVAALILLDGMFISGTRGAFFTLLSGMAVALIINKNIKVLVIGAVVVGILVGGLKFTSIGSGVYAINRMRTALDPQDASFNVRLNNQKKLHDYLATRPFGAGVGAMGYGARQFNKGTYIGSIPCDSYWVLVWGMYGIVGFILWMSSMMYVLGKSCGIVWNIKNEKLRFKLTALTAGSAGIFFSSYGNEVMNFTPSSVVLYVSWAFIFLGPRLDVDHSSLYTHKSILYPNHENI
jgi:hypothetical protein